MRGVIAAIATPITPQNQPDHPRFLAHAKSLLAGGCDGLNILGTTGEATSLSVGARKALMQYAADNLPLERLMVGTGATALADCIELNQSAAAMGFAGTLLLPPFYFKGVSDEGLFEFVSAVAEASVSPAIPFYLYNFPQMTGIIWSAELIKRLKTSLGPRLAGLKDSSGNMDYARSVAADVTDFAVFPSNEACLIEARSGIFAGCISATANLNADYCVLAFRDGDTDAMAKASAIRAQFDGRPLVAGIKEILAHHYSDPTWRRVVPPLTVWPDQDHLEAFKAITLIRSTP